MEPYARDMHPEGYQTISCASLRLTISLFLNLLYPLPRASMFPASNAIPAKTDRNREIYDRYIAGERALTLAQEFRISVRRVNRLITRLKGS